MLGTRYKTGLAKPRKVQKKLCFHESSEKVPNTFPERRFKSLLESTEKVQKTFPERRFKSLMESTEKVQKKLSLLFVHRSQKVQKNIQTLKMAALWQC